MKVYEFMTTKIQTIDHDRTVYDAIEMMVDRRIRSLIVQFPGSDTGHGVVTARDVVAKVLAEGLNPDQLQVGTIASKPIVCIDRNMSMQHAARLMEESHIARVFVCQEGTIIGVVSLLDVMAATLIKRARGSDVS